jgi:hypothetical protein
MQSHAAGSAVVMAGGGGSAVQHPDANPDGQGKTQLKAIFLFLSGNCKKNLCHC